MQPDVQFLVNQSLKEATSIWNKHSVYFPNIFALAGFNRNYALHFLWNQVQNSLILVVIV